MSKWLSPKRPDGLEMGTVLADLKAGIVRREGVEFELDHFDRNIQFVLNQTEQNLKDSP